MIKWDLFQKWLIFELEIEYVPGDIDTQNLKPNYFKRRDYTFGELVTHADVSSMPLFSDLGEDVFIPQALKEYPPVHFLKLFDAY